MNVLMFSPGFPAEMPYFTRGLAQVGAKVYGLGDQPVQSLPDEARHALTDYLRVRHLWDFDSLLEQIQRWGIEFDRIECLWEPGMLLAAQLREALGTPGMTVAETVPFRDKEKMKLALDEAGIRTPRHVRAETPDEVREAAEKVGFPICIKPIAGAGSADTYRVDDQERLEEVIKLTGHVAEVSVEEFIEGEEYTFDTICADGEVLYYNIAWYLPPPLIARTVEWISPQTITLRDVENEHIRDGHEMGFKVLKALGFKTGFTHMEWFRKPNGEAVFGEIAARPPGARSTEIMNYGCDLDVFNGWAEAVCHGKLTQRVERKYNAAVIFKRAQGEGHIRQIEGLQTLKRDFGSALVNENLSPVGAPRRNWKQTLVSDGYLIVRHSDLDKVREMADRVGTELQIYAG